MIWWTKESTTDDIIRRSGMPSSTVSVALLGLEMKRLVRVQKLIPIYSRKEGVIPFGQDRVFE